MVEPRGRRQASWDHAPTRLFQDGYTRRRFADTASLGAIELQYMQAEYEANQWRIDAEWLAELYKQRQRKRAPAEPPKEPSRWRPTPNMEQHEAPRWPGS